MLAAFALILLTTVLLGYRLGAGPFERSSERRCHDVAREMVESGDYLVPRLDGAIRLQKPPLYYWLAAGTSHVLGEVSLLSTRLPSAIAALLLLLVLMRYAATTGSASVSLLSGVFLLLSFQFATSGRRGDAEMWLALSSLCAILSFDRYAATGAIKWLAAFALALLVAFLAKATVAFVTVVLPVVLMTRFTMTRRRASIRATALALLVATSLGFAWHGWLLLSVDGAFYEMLGDLALPFGVTIGESDDAAHTEAPWFFAEKFFSVSFPAALLLPLVVWRIRATRGYCDDPSKRSIWIAACAQFVVFSLLPQKQKHYLLPLVPLYALLAADAVIALRDHPAVMRVLRNGLRVIAGAGVGAALVILWSAGVFDPAGIARTAPFLACAAVTGAWLCVGSCSISWPRANALIVLCVVGLLGDYYGRFVPWRETLDHAADEGEALPTEALLRSASREYPWLASLTNVDDILEDADEARGG